MGRVTLTYRHSEAGTAWDGKTIPPKPLVRVVLCDREGNPRVELDALLDTGATVSTFTFDTLAQLGIRPEDCRSMEAQTQKLPKGPMLGLDGGLEAHLPIEGTDGFYVFRVRPIFNPNFDADADALLGRVDFLKAFRIASWDERAGTFELEPYPDTLRIGLSVPGTDEAGRLGPGRGAG